MSLRTTTLLIVIIIFIGLVALLVLNLQANLSTHFSKLENQSATLMVARAQGIFDLEMESLNLIAQEWSKRSDVAAQSSKVIIDVAHTWVGCLYLIGLNLSNEQTAAELDLLVNEVQAMTSHLREGIVVKKANPLDRQG